MLVRRSRPVYSGRTTPADNTIPKTATATTIAPSNNTGNISRSSATAVFGHGSSSLNNHQPPSANIAQQQKSPPRDGSPAIYAINSIEAKHGVGFSISHEQGFGWRVTFIVENSSAANAGLEVGDCVECVDGEIINSTFDPLSILGPKGSTVILVVRNKGTLELLRAGPPLDPKGVRQDGMLGLYFKNNRVITGIDPNGASAKQGVQVGDILVAVDGRKLVDNVPVQKQLSLQGPSGSKVKLELLRNVLGHFGNYQANYSVVVVRKAVGTGWPESPNNSRDDQQPPKQQPPTVLEPAKLGKSLDETLKFKQQQQQAISTLASTNIAGVTHHHAGIDQESRIATLEFEMKEMKRQQAVFSRIMDDFFDFKTQFAAFRADIAKLVSK